MFLLIGLLLFSSSSADYNEEEARKLMKLAAGAYGKEVNIQECMSQVLSRQDSHTVLTMTAKTCDILDNLCEGYIVVSNHEKVLYIVFRGTKSGSQLLLQGWSTLQPGKDFYDMGLVNRYFFKGHRLLWDSVNQTLTDPHYRNYKVVFTGHSLGGALATLGAARTARENLRRSDQIRLVTFGAPRVGSAEFAFNLDRRIPESFRVVFRKDIVPHLPACEKDRSDPNLKEKHSRPCDPKVLDKAYHHGTEIWYPESMEQGSRFLVCQGQPKNEDFQCSNQFKYRLTNTDEYIWDHRHYFGVRVPRYGKAGCNITVLEEKYGRR